MFRGAVKGDVLQSEWSEERVANKLGHAEQRFEPERESPEVQKCPQALNEEELTAEQHERVRHE